MRGQRVQADAVASQRETCEVVWWRGYVKGRFQAYGGAGDARELLAESPPIRWRSADPPEPTEAAVRALDELTARLAEGGWEVEDGASERWFRLRLSRPAAAAPQPLSRPAAAREPEPQPRQLDDALLADLRAQLAAAQAGVRLERDRRLEAEAEALRLREPPPTRRATQPLSAWALLAAYAIAVAAAGVVGYIGFASAYGAAVATLTALAVVVALDSWIVARRRATTAG